jgi:hypothetical protein
MTFTGAWFTPVVPIDKHDDYEPAEYCYPTVSDSVDVASLLFNNALMPKPLSVDDTEPFVK